MQSPTAEPRIPASARGVSTQRSAPKRSRRPAVARKTPPARPTSSPRTSTSGSRSISTWSASFTASTRRRSGTEDPPQLGEVVLEGLRRVRERVLEQEPDVGGRLGFGRRDAGTHDVCRVALDLLLELVVEDAGAPQVALVAADALVRTRLLDALQIDVRARIVGGGVRRRAIGNGLDEGRPLPGATAGDGFARSLVDREHVAAVHAEAWNPVAGGLVDEGLGTRLVGERGGDRPVVVVAEQDDRRAHHGGEVGALVEGALGGGAVAEEGERAGALAPQALAPREPGRVRDLRRDRDADRCDVVVGRVPPPHRMAAPPREHRRRRHSPQQPDRGLAVAREDPVVVVEGVKRAGLDRLVPPEDRVRADPALAVIDDRALVVRAQQHHRAVEVEQSLLPEPLHLPVGNGGAVADHATEVVLRRDGAHHRRADSTRQTSTETAARSASKTTSVTSPRSSPSSCSGCGTSHRRTIRSTSSSRRSGSRVRPVTTYRTAPGMLRAPKERGASRSSPPSSRAPRGSRNGSRPT